MEELCSPPPPLATTRLPRVASPSGGVSADAVRSALDKILASKSFANSSRHRDFLRFAVEASLSGTGHTLKEYVLGVEIFNRKSTFDPHIDPIVRVEASRIRTKLKAYYENEGLADSTLISLPRGSYAPIFQTRFDALPSVPEEKQSFGTRYKWIAAVFATALIVSMIALSLGFMNVYRPSLSRTESYRAITDISSIAVLPFVNLGSEKEIELFSDGLTEELMNTLTKEESFRIVARTSTFQYKGKVQDVRNVGTQLNVSTVLEGSVRHSGAQLRIAARLIDARSGYELWSDTYDCKAEQALGIQYDISEAIVNALRVRKAGGRALPFSGRHTFSLKAYNLYLEGIYQERRRSYVGTIAAVESFQNSIAADPQFAPAHSRLAATYAKLLKWGVLSATEGLPKAEAAAQKAITLDTGLAEAHASLATVNSLSWRWDAARTEFGRAIERDPGNAETREQYAVSFLLPTKQVNQAIDQLLKAKELDPLSASISTSLGKSYYCRRDFEHAIEHYRNAIDLQPALWYAYMGVGSAFAQKSMFAEAISAEANKASPDNAAAISSLGYVYGVSNRVADAQMLLARLDQLSKQKYVSSYSKALVYLGLGDKDRTMRHLERAYEERDSALTDIAVDPVWSSLRSDPRLIALLAKIGLPN